MNNFTPFYIENSFDLNKDLETFALKNKLDSTKFELEILDINFFVNDVKLKLESNELENIQSEKKFNLANVNIKQSFNVRVIPKIEDDFFSLHLNKFKNKLFIYFMPEFVYINNEQFLAFFIKKLESKIARMNIIFRDMDSTRTRVRNILESNLDSSLSESEFMLDSSFQKNRLFCIKESLTFIPPRNANFKFFSKEKWEIDNNNPAPLNAAFGVAENETIGIYTHAILGASGRNLCGEFIKTSNVDIESLKLNSPIFNSDEIELINDEFIAKKTGFLSFKNNEFKFIDLTNFVFKTSASPHLLNGLHLDLSIEVESRDEFSDAISEGFMIEANEVLINGYIAKDCIIKANNLVLNGASEKASKIIAKNAKILTLKGELVCENCIVKNVDSGFIKARNVKIINTLGAKIYAKNIELDSMKNNNKIYINGNLKINNASGENNEIHIESKSDLILESKINNALNIKEKLEDSIQKINNNLDSINDFFNKNEYANDKSNFILLYKNYLKIIHKLFNHKLQIATQKINKIEKALKDLDYNLKNCFIESNSNFGEQNILNINCEFLNINKQINIDSRKIHIESYIKD